MKHIKDKCVTQCCHWGGNVPDQPFKCGKQKNSNKEWNL